MVVEKFIPDFLVWLLGPGWKEGWLFQTIPFILAVLAALGAIGALVAAARAGRGWAGRAAAYAIGFSSLACVLLFGLLMGRDSIPIKRVDVRTEIDAKAQKADEKTQREKRYWLYVDEPSRSFLAVTARKDPLGSSPLTLLDAKDTRYLVEFDPATGLCAAADEHRGPLRFVQSVDSLSSLLGDEWREGKLYQWLVAAAILTLAVLLIGLMTAVLRHGPTAGLRAVDETLTGLVAELACFSPRRLWALTWLGVQESIRRRVVIGFAIFILVLLFAGWFLDPGNPNPARLYLDFVLSTTTYPVLLLALIVSAFSLPADIRTKTLHTVVTKPVHPSEIVLGRMLGFTLTGTALLVVMGLISYVFVVRGLAHAHELDPKVVADARARAGSGGEVDVVTSKAHNHRHPVHIDAKGRPSLGTANGHRHDIEVEEDGTYWISGPKDELLARVPVYGTLRFLDRQGRPADKGINVGDEWTYRGNIEGGTSCAAIWTFEGITEDRFSRLSEGIPLELTLGVFRSWKGDIAKGIAGSISVRNPKTKETGLVTLFTAKEFKVDSHVIPWDVEGHDLLDHYVSDGQMEVVLRCLDRGQFFGVAQADVYIRADDAPFALNLAKGYLGIWMQMVMVIGLGVTFSTFLSGPVAAVATGGTVLLGYFSEFVYKLATRQTYGGGFAESLIRLPTQQNVISELEPTPAVTVAKMVDDVIRQPLWAVSKLLPPMGDFGCATYVADGFNYPWQMVLANALCVLGFLLPVFVLGYLFLKTREVAK